jgi:hypothetical protein
MPERRLGDCVPCKVRCVQGYCLRPDRRPNQRHVYHPSPASRWRLLGDLRSQTAPGPRRGPGTSQGRPRRHNHQGRHRRLRAACRMVGQVRALLAGRKRGEPSLGWSGRFDQSHLEVLSVGQHPPRMWRVLRRRPRARHLRRRGQRRGWRRGRGRRVLPSAALAGVTPTANVPVTHHADLGEWRKL